MSAAQWTRVDITVPPGALGLVVSKTMDRRGERSHVVVDGFRPIAATGEQGVLQQSGKVVPGSRLLGVNEHDFTDAQHPLSFDKIRDILINTSGVERVVRFLVPPAARGEQQQGADLPIAPAHARRFTDEYALGKELGSGTFSVVREATHRTTGEKFAIKCIKRAELSKDDLEALMAEVAILKEMQHPHIVKLYDVFQEDRYYFLVTEFMRGGELFERIVKKNFYSEREARDLVKVLLESIKFIHDANVVHRDLKPENLLLMSADDDTSIKLADFGFAKKVTTDNSGLVTTCGTPGYVAPEILEGASYGKPVDIWSIGVITYILLAGYPPFHDDSQPILFRKIRKGKYYYDSPYWDNVSDDAKEFISKMLVVDPAQRSTAADLLQHKWITGTDVATVPLTSALTELRRFHARKKFKAAVHSVQATISMNKAMSLSLSETGSSLSSASSTGGVRTGAKAGKAADAEVSL